MELFLMTLITGIMVGGIYALVALGWVLIYKCSGVLNLAMGELTLIGAYVALTFYQMGMPFIVSVLCTLVIGIALGFLTERIFLDKLIGEPILSVIMVTVGLSFFFKGLVEFLWGTDTRVFDPPVFSIKPIALGLLKVSPVYLWSFILSIVLLIIFVCFFKYTRWGLSMQATADDETAALSLGVSARFVYAAAWAIAFMSAGSVGRFWETSTASTFPWGTSGSWSCRPWSWEDSIPFPAPLWEGLSSASCRTCRAPTWITISQGGSRKSCPLPSWRFFSSSSLTACGGGRGSRGSRFV